MAFSVAVASGKGGTGKTTVALNLFQHLSHSGSQVQLVDCDVEAPNIHLFSGCSALASSQEVFRQVPVISTDPCVFCRKCVDACAFNAIIVIPHLAFAEVNPNLCHSCGACYLECPHGAIRSTSESIGQIRAYETGGQQRISDGVLKIGSSMQSSLIRALLKSLPPKLGFRIIDSPPGSSCPAVESMRSADYLILVTEPTPFGLHDLKIMVELARQLSLPIGVVVNKAGLGSSLVHEYLEEEDIELLLEIPFSREMAAQYAGGVIPGAGLEAVSQGFQRLQKYLEKKQFEA